MAYQTQSLFKKPDNTGNNAPTPLQPSSGLNLGYIGFARRNQPQYSESEGSLPQIHESTNLRLSKLNHTHKRMFDDIKEMRASEGGKGHPDLSTPRTKKLESNFRTMEDIFAGVDFALKPQATTFASGVERDTQNDHFSVDAKDMVENASFEGSQINLAKEGIEQRRLSQMRLELLALGRDDYVLVGKQGQLNMASSSIFDDPQPRNGSSSNACPFANVENIFNSVPQEMSEFELDLDGPEGTGYDAELEVDSGGDELDEVNDFDSSDDLMGSNSDISDVDAQTTGYELNNDRTSGIDPHEVVDHTKVSIRSSSPAPLEHEGGFSHVLGPDIFMAFPRKNVIFDHLLAEGEDKMIESLEKCNESFDKEMRRLSILPQDALALDEGDLSEVDGYEEYCLNEKLTRSAGKYEVIHTPSVEGSQNIDTISFTSYGEEFEDESLDIDIQRALLEEHNVQEKPVIGKGKGKAID